jgi:hypothetical protein
MNARGNAKITDNAVMNTLVLPQNHKRVGNIAFLRNPGYIPEQRFTINLQHLLRLPHAGR